MGNAKIVGPGSGLTHEVASGTGGMIIQKWRADRLSIGFFEYKPSMTFYDLEDLEEDGEVLLIDGSLI